MRSRTSGGGREWREGYVTIRSLAAFRVPARLTVSSRRVWGKSLLVRNQRVFSRIVYLPAYTCVYDNEVFCPRDTCRIDSAWASPYLNGTRSARNLYVLRSRSFLIELFKFQWFRAQRQCSIHPAVIANENHNCRPGFRCPCLFQLSSLFSW